MNVSRLAHRIGCTRQALYESPVVRQTHPYTDLWLEYVRAVRCRHPRMGIVKLRHKFLEHSQLTPYEAGRDWCFEVARDHELLAAIPRRGHPRTTYSQHRLGYAPYLAKDMVPTGPNQLWVADLTYIRTRKGWAYLALLTDAFSRKVVGWDVSTSLEMAGCLRTLQRALKSERPAAGLIHHSDRGVQYACTQYRKSLLNADLKASMTEYNHCYENALAERVNGILKHEYLLNSTFDDLNHAKKAVDESIWLYNNERPHSSINMNYPAILHAS